MGRGLPTLSLEGKRARSRQMFQQTVRAAPASALGPRAAPFLPMETELWCTHLLVLPLLLRTLAKYLATCDRTLHSHVPAPTVFQLRPGRTWPGSTSLSPRSRTVEHQVGSSEERPEPPVPQNPSCRFSRLSRPEILRIQCA